MITHNAIELRIYAEGGILFAKPDATPLVIVHWWHVPAVDDYVYVLTDAGAEVGGTVVSRQWHDGPGAQFVTLEVREP